MEPYAPYPLNLVRDWFHCRRWWVRLTLAVVLVPWFGHFAYTRIATRPVTPIDPWNSDFGLAVPDPAVDRTSDMAAAIGRLPPPTTMPAPTSAPAGLEWVDWGTLKARREGTPRQAPGVTTGQLEVNPRIAFEGEWTVKTRYHLAHLVTYLDLPATEAALDDIAALAATPFCMSHSSAFPGGGFSGLAAADRATELLIARARRRMAGNHDFDRAVGDIQAALDLAAGVEDDQTSVCVLGGMARRRWAVCEILYWTQEFPLTGVQIRVLQDLLSRHRPDPRCLRDLVVRGEILLAEDQIDRMCTTDSRGDGWYVPAYEIPVRANEGVPAVLNLLSPFFDGRRQTREQALRYWQEQRDRMEQLPSPDAARGSGCCCAPPLWNLASPAFLVADSGLPSRIHILSLRDLALVDGAIAALGLVAYEQGHGRYPNELGEIVPEYLSTLPYDPFSGKPLRYRVEGNRYLLYSVDVNRVDDNGVQFGPNHEALDLPVVQERREPQYSEEWFLVPAVNPGQKVDHVQSIRQLRRRN
jgi:hypothetical protein